MADGDTSPERLVNIDFGFDATPASSAACIIDDTDEITGPEVATSATIIIETAPNHSLQILHSEACNAADGDTSPERLVNIDNSLSSEEHGH